MYIKTYKTKRFAGLKDTHIDFNKGLNVILGPNEAGKSTIIDGIHSTLFKDIRLRRSVKLDNEFIYKFMPKPGGDYIDGELVLVGSEGDYKLSKEWGSQESIEFTKPNGDIIREEKQVKKELSKLLDFGQASYSNIVFAKQRDFKKSLENISKDPQVSKEITDLLRRALMELDGISIDSIENNLNIEIDRLYKRWDRDKNYPENNRGVSNPYKTGLGKIVETYYKKENLNLKKERVKITEINFEKLSQQVQELEEERENLNKERKKLEFIESDINKRAILELEIKEIEKNLQEAMKINSQWPVIKERVNYIDREVKDVDLQLEKLKNEKELLFKYKKKLALERQYEDLIRIDENIGKINKDLSSLVKIEDKDLQELSKIDRRLDRIDANMEAGLLIGRVKILEDEGLSLCKDYENWLDLKIDQEFTSRGQVKLRYKNELELELKTGDIDFQELKLEKDRLKKKYKSILHSFNLYDLEEAYKNVDFIKNKENKLSNLLKEKEIVLDGRSIEDIRLELEKLEDVKDIRDNELIDSETEYLNKKKLDLLSDRRSKLDQINLWEEKYNNIDTLFEILVEEKSIEKIKREEIQKLEKLPENFTNIGEFKSRISYLKNKLELINQDLDEKRSEYYQVRNQLLDETYEELNQEYLKLESKFKDHLKRGDKLIKIRQVFLQTKEEMLENPMEPLVEDFSKLLKIITQGDYSLGEIDEDFNIRLEGTRGHMPVDLLSAGTYDAVSLSLRFALVKYIFKGEQGYLVLDDCLVDLDPKRKKASIDLIQKFSKDYQIIFTTCDPETASLLGGNIINLEEK